MERPGVLSSPPISSHAEVYNNLNSRHTPGARFCDVVLGSEEGTSQEGATMFLSKLNEMRVDSLMPPCREIGSVSIGGTYVISKRMKEKIA
jgi:hypothetical protein